MKEKVIIEKDGNIVFQGRILNMPIKEDHIISKSIEVFGDDEPCIIHQSFVVKELVTEILDLFSDNDTLLLHCKDHLEQLSFINFEDLNNITIKLVRKNK